METLPYLVSEKYNSVAKTLWKQFDDIYSISTQWISATDRVREMTN